MPISAGDLFYYFDASNNTSTTKTITITPIGATSPIYFYLFSAGGAGGDAVYTPGNVFGGGGGGSSAIVYSENYLLNSTMTVTLSDIECTISDANNSAILNSAGRGGDGTGSPGLGGTPGTGTITTGTDYRYVIGSSGNGGTTNNGGYGASDTTPSTLTSLTIGTTTIDLNTGGAGGLGNTNTLPFSGTSGGGGGGGGSSNVSGAQSGAPGGAAYFVLYYNLGRLIISETGGITFSNSTSVVTTSHSISSGKYIQVNVNGTNYYLPLLV
jgi:hypothetical protein